MRDPGSLPDEGFARLVAVMACLRAEDGGCPWDREQTLASLRTFLIEESHELLDAIDQLGEAARALPADLPRLQAPEEQVRQFREELGDVLLQIAFQSRIAEEAGWFSAQDVARGIADKMIRRHPHVFATETPEPPVTTSQAVTPPQAMTTPQAVTTQWEQIKRKEGKGALAGVPRNLPSLLRAQRIGEKAARIGFDWPDARGVVDKVGEELAELQEAMASGDRAAMQEELGDLLFALSSLARHLGVDAELGLRETLDKFTRRFTYVEAEIERRHGREHRADLDALEALWQEAKRRERGGEG